MCEVGGCAPHCEAITGPSRASPSVLTDAPWSQGATTTVLHCGTYAGQTDAAPSSATPTASTESRSAPMGPCWRRPALIARQSSGMSAPSVVETGSGGLALGTPLHSARVAAPLHWGARITPEAYGITRRTSVSASRSPDTRIG